MAVVYEALASHFFVAEVAVGFLVQVFFPRLLSFPLEQYDLDTVLPAFESPPIGQKTKTRSLGHGGTSRVGSFQGICGLRLLRQLLLEHVAV